MVRSGLETRRQVMGRSIALGHCACDARKPCPCDTFKLYDVCECAGERLPRSAPVTGLTQLVRKVGCAGKIGKRDLFEALRGLPDFEDPRVLVGRDAGDDAGIIMLSESQATVFTVDVFTPPVDDPFTFGQIAAANSLSDVYAMGAAPQCALSIVGFPARTLPLEVMREIMRGGFEKMREAGIAVIGGHSIDEEEIKFGFAVLGTAAPDSFVTNRGACPGDIMVLTKPLGTGIVTFAGQCGRATAEGLEQATRSMIALNRVAGSRMRDFGAHAATDITGFGLLNHLAEVARSSNAELCLHIHRLPLLDGVAGLVERGVFPGAVERNREAMDHNMVELDRLSLTEQSVLFGPETPGGLVVFLPEQFVAGFLDVLHRGGVEQPTIIGRVLNGIEGGKIRIE
jgi:selenide,water dikinase